MASEFEALTLDDNEVRRLRDADAALVEARARLQQAVEQESALRSSRDAVAAAIADRDARRVQMQAERITAAEAGDEQAVARLAQSMSVYAEVSEAQSRQVAEMSAELEKLAAFTAERERELAAAEATRARVFEAAGGRAPRVFVERLAVVEVAAKATLAHLRQVATGEPGDVLALLAELAAVPVEVARRAISDPEWLVAELEAEDERVQVKAAETDEQRRRRERVEAERRERAEQVKAAARRFEAEAAQVRAHTAMSGLGLGGGGGL